MRRLFVLGFAVAVLLLAAGVARAEFSATVVLEKKAQVLSDGSAVVRLQVTCVGPVLEANLSLTQGNTSNLQGFGGIVCDGETHTIDVHVTPLEGPYVKGKAFASAFVLICDDSVSECTQGQNFGTVKLKRKPL
jgi:hypothetical protein